MSASRTSAFLRNAHNSPYANNLANIAKNVSTDVVDQIVNKQPRDSVGSEADALHDAFLTHDSLFSDFGADVGTFGSLEELEQFDVPPMYDGDGDAYADMDVLSSSFSSAAPAPSPSVMAPAPAPSANPFAAGRLEDPFADFGSSLAKLRSQDRKSVV